MIRALNSTFVNATKCLFATPIFYFPYHWICDAQFIRIGSFFYSVKYCRKNDYPMTADQYKNCKYSLNYNGHNADSQNFTISDGSDSKLTTLLNNLIKKGYLCTIKECNDIINDAIEHVTTKLTGVESTETTLGNLGYIESEYSNTASNISGNYAVVNNTTNKLNQTIDSNLDSGLDIDPVIGGAIIAYIALGGMLVAYHIYKSIESNSNYNNKIAQGQDFMFRSDGCTNYNHQHDNYEDNISFSIISESEENSICTGNISCNIIEASVDSAHC